MKEPSFLGLSNKFACVLSAYCHRGQLIRASSRRLYRQSSLNPILLKFGSAFVATKAAN